jgi:hypothetical protein
MVVKKAAHSSGFFVGYSFNNRMYNFCTIKTLLQLNFWWNARNFDFCTRVEFFSGAGVDNTKIGKAG